MTTQPNNDLGVTVHTPRMGRAPAAPVGSTGAALSPVGWQRERARRLQRICTCLARRVQRGGSLRKGVRYFVWYWKERSYKSAPARPVRLSRPTLLRAYYRWQSVGRTPEAFALRYRAVRPKISVEAVVELAGLALEPKVISFSAAFRKLPHPVGTESAYRYGMGRSLRAGFGQLFSARRKVLSAERKARQLLADFQGDSTPKA